MATFRLGWFMDPGVTIQGWNGPGFPQVHDWTKPALFQDMIRAMERACFDLFRGGSVKPNDVQSITDELVPALQNR